MLNYLRWQFLDGPKWLLEVLWNLELALLQFFSVGFLLRTLFAHWHKDAVRYDRSSISSIFISFAWNQISRGVGFVVRSSVLLAWLCIQLVFLAVATSIWLLFVIWPFLIILLLAYGLFLF